LLKIVYEISNFSFGFDLSKTYAEFPNSSFGFQFYWKTFTEFLIPVSVLIYQKHTRKIFIFQFLFAIFICKNKAF